MKSKTRTPWLDPATESPVIDDQAARLAGFLGALADGEITSQELADQEARVVELMKKVEPELSDAAHADATRLLCELTAWNIMKTMHEMSAAAPKTRFRG